MHFLMLCAFSAFASTGAQGQALTEEDFERAQTIDFKALVEEYAAQNISVELLGSTGHHDDLSDDKGVPKAIWENGVIPYEISPGFSQNDRAGIANAIAYIQTQTCLRFKPYDGGNAKMTFTPVNMGGACYTSWTTDGRGKTTAEVQLSPNSQCTVARTVVHEVCSHSTIL